MKKINNLYFGTELEFEKLASYKMQSIIEDFNKDRELDWAFTSDDTVETTCQFSGLLLGGEFVSPKYEYGSVNFEKDIVDITDILKKHHVKITNKVSNHFHFNASYFNRSLEWADLIEAWLAYEPIIYRFGFSKELMGRSLSWDYARPLGIKRDWYLKIVDRMQSNYVLLEDAKYNLVRGEYPLFKKEKGLNFNGVIYDIDANAYDYCSVKPKKPTIEFRNCDLSLDPEEIKMRVKTFGSLLSAVKNNKFDYKYLRYLNNNHFCQIKERNNYGKYKLSYEDKALEFAKVIFDDNNKDIASFMKIYRK